MANTRFFLDERCSKGLKPSVLKVAIAHKGKSALVSLDAKILSNQWDGKKSRVVNHPDQMLMNVYISNVKQQIDTIILTLANEGRLGSMNAAEIKQVIENHLHPEKQQAKKHWPNFKLVSENKEDNHSNRGRRQIAAFHATQKQRK